jgi:flagellin-like hook-associated protein FlgL
VDNNAPDPGVETSLITMNSTATLLDTAAAGATVPAGSTSWYDRTGAAHSVGFTFTKIADGDGINTGDTWKYTLTGVDQDGVWTGDNENHQDIIIQFNASGSSVESVNGAAGETVTVNLGDGTAAGQDVVLDFSTLAIGVTSAVVQAQNGQSGTPSSTVDFMGDSQRLVTGQGPKTFMLAPIVDRTGTQLVNGASITFTQVGDTNEWTYTIAAPDDSGFTGQVISGGSGSVLFQEDGDLIMNDPLHPVEFQVKFADGTAEGQTLTFTLEDATSTGLKMIRDSDLRKSATDGGPGAGDPQVDAVIYWTDGGKGPTIVSTLEGVSQGAKSYEAGGIILTVNTVTRHDVGMVAYTKTLTYVSATTEDNALQFQTGSDEGEVFRVGIQKLSVDKLFRRDHYQGDEDKYEKLEDYDPAAGGSISVATTLQAQDLIGQIDDALRLVGRSNVKVGAFKNEFDRTLEQQRSNHTQMANAYANINDADMAMEATNQSKRMILIQSATAMVAQANTTSQFVLQLMR